MSKIREDKICIANVKSSRGKYFRLRKMEWKIYSFGQKSPIVITKYE